MRSLWWCLPLVVVAGCSAVEDDGAESSADRLSQDGKKESGSVAWGPCAASRSAILASVSSARAEAIERGFRWLDADVPFNMSATHETYRTDCSGFVSMCWQLPSPGRSTRDFGNAGSGSHRLASYDDLVPADALVRAGRHSVIFLGWNDSARRGACVLEQSSTKNDMQFRVRLTATLESEGFVPVRADRFRNDTTYRPTTSTGTSEADRPSSTDEDTTETPADPPVCSSRPAATICAEAQAARGVMCGRVADDCGRAVDCSNLPGFGCSADEVCRTNRCTSTCTPKSAADICLTAKLASGVECGSVPDGCGGTVDCDTVPTFGCGEGVCGETAPNRCPAAPEAETPPSTTPEGESLPPSFEGDPGDEEDEVWPSSRSGEEDYEEDDEPAPRKKSRVASSGCSAAPASAPQLGGHALLALVALGSLRRRRASKR